MKPLYHPAAARRLRVRRLRWSPYRYTRWRWHVLFALMDAIGWLLLGPRKLVATTFRLIAGPRVGRDLSSDRVTTILVVQLDHLGDAVLSLGLLWTLRRHYANARLHVLTSPWNDELFATSGCVDHVHVIENSRFSRQGGWAWLKEIVRWGRRLRRYRFDLAIDARGEFPHAALMWLAGARRRIGWACGGGGFFLSDRMPYLAGRPEALSRAAIAKKLGLEVESSATGPITPHLALAESSLRWADEQLAKVWPAGRPTKAPGPLIALHVGAGTSAKQWPAEAWRDLADRLIGECGARVVVVGARQDRAAAEMATGIPNLLPDGLPRLNLAGSLTLSKLAAVLHRADLFIGADSGPAHLAAAVGTPVLSLFSGTNDVEQWKPRGPHVAVLRNATECSPCHREACAWADHPCMHGITPESVAHQAIEMLTRVGTARQSGRVGCAHQNTLGACDDEPSNISDDPSSSQPTPASWWAQRALRRLRGWATPALQWLLAGWMATVAVAYLWRMLAHRGL